MPNNVIPLYAFSSLLHCYAFCICHKVQLSTTEGSWVTKFDLPSKFTKKTTEAIKTGILTKSARTEIVAAMHTHAYDTV